ncbi:MAG TPA: VWA domain-containing protein [Candidatus Acidoferrum sp.]|nr:VWA domain-containing protein [Candidatus Acidoferrum sp.]
MSWLPAGFVENFHFLRPLWLYGLIPALVLVLLLRLAQTARNNWVRAIDATLLPYLLDKKMTAAQTLPLYGLLLAWLLGVVALAGPVWQKAPVPVQRKQDAVVIVLDLSLSMYATDLSPNRATRAQRKIMDILNFRRQEGQTGLVVYAGDAHAVTPMTDDVETISNLVPSLQPNIMPVPGSDPAAGVKLALELLNNSKLPNARILLLTDGITNSDIDSITSLVAGSGNTLSVIGFGTDAGSPVPMGQQGYLRDDNNAIVIPRLERGPLQQLAAANGGQYTDAQLTDADVTALLKQDVLDENQNLKAVEDRKFDAWIETGPWLVLLVLPLAALAFRRGWVFVLLVGVLMAPSPKTYAWEWRDLWERKDQQGSKAFDGGDYAGAAARFKDPGWRAAAEYRNGDFQGAVNDLTPLGDAESNYNRGNAFAKLGQYESALASYNQALAQNPDHADAKHNKEIIEKLLKQQQEQKDKQNQQSGDEKQQQKDKQNQDQQNQNQNQDQQNQQQQQQQNQQQQNQQNQQNKQDQQKQDQQQQQNDEDKQDKNEKKKPEQQNAKTQRPNEEEQAMQQWLMRIPDDPGELLRNKFRYQSQQQLMKQLQRPGTGAGGRKQSW